MSATKFRVDLDQRTSVERNANRWRISCINSWEIALESGRISVRTHFKSFVRPFAPGVLNGVNDQMGRFSRGVVDQSWHVPPHDPKRMTGGACDLIYSTDDTHKVDRYRVSQI